ncbi:unnamed protein product [Sympodiomycopsis kandeliae]
MHSTTTSPCSQAKFKDATLTSGTRGEHCATNMNTTKPLGTPSSRREDIDMITPKLALSVAPVTIHTTPFKCSLNSNSDEDDSDLRSTSLPRMLGENVNAVNLTRCGSSAGLQSAGVHEKQALVMPARTPGTPPFSFRADASASANADCKCDGDADADGGASNERTDDSKGCPCARQQQRQGVMRSSAIISQSKTTKENEAKSGLSGSLPPSRRAKKAVTFAVQVQCEDWNKAKPEFEKTIAQSQSLSPDESSTSLPSPSPLAFCPFRTASPLPLALLRASSGTTQLLCTAFPQNAPLQQQQQQHHSVQHPRGSLSGIRFSSDVEDTACERELPIISLTTPDLKTVLVIQPSNRARSSIAATAKTKTTLQADSGDPNIYQAQKSPTGSTASPLSSPSRQVFMSAQNSDGAVEAGKLKDLPAFELADWPTRKSDAGHSSNSTSTASTCTPSPEDHFLTPRAGSPFFPTSFSGLPPGLTSASHQESSPKAEAYVLAPSDTSSIVSSQETLTIQSLAEPDSNTGLQSMRDASALGSIDTQSTASSSQAGPSKVQGCPSDNPSAGLGWSSDSVQSHSPKLAVRASYDASSSAPLQESQSTSPIATSWPEQLRASLVQEGLTETALTAEQEIQSLVAGATVPAAGLDALASNGPTSPHSQAQEDASKMASSSSDISRTPSTSTTCSIATSQASAETAPSSVPSEADGVESKFEIENLSAESFAPSTLLADERNSQSKIRRYHALLELVETERSYTNDLSVLVHVYLETLPLQPYFEDHPARVETVVRNTPELLNIHNDIAGFLEEILEREGISVNDPGDDIEKAMSKGVGIAISEIGTFFCNLSQRLTAYQDFCARHAETLAIIREAERRHNGDDFAAFERLCSNILRSRPGSAYSSTTEVNRLSRQSSYSVLGATTTSPAVRTAPLSPLTSIPSELPDALHGAIVAPRSNSNGGKQQGGRLKFADLLIKPVQRLCLYPLVLHTLLKHTGPDDVGKEELQAAMATMKTVADQVDAAGRRREQFLISELVASRLDPQPPVTKALLSRIGPLELSGTLDLLYHHFQIAPLVAPLRFRFLGLFLYHHWLLVVKLGKSGSYVPRHWFPLHQAELSSINEGEGALPHAFRLTVNHEHHFELAASSSKEMAMWVDKLATGIALATEDDGPKLPSSLSDAHDTAVLSALDRSCDVTTRSRSRADSNSDPLRDFLVHQSAVATSAEVLVRYATLNQRANVDRGMVFSDAILGARAVAQKDGSYTPGGSLTKNSPGSTQSPTPTGSTSTVNLTSWHAATNNTSSLGAAVGAAMGFARAAKRSSRQSVTNAFEAAAQQYLANEEQRLAEENKAAQQLAWQRNSPSGTRGESDAANSASATLNTSRPGYSSRRKRASFAIGSSARPLSTIFTSSGTSIRTPSPANETGLLSSPLTSPSPTTLDSFSPESVVSPDRSPGQSAQGSRLKRRQSGSSGAALRDAIASAGAWSRRTRSRSSEIDSGRLAAMHFSTPAGEQLASPQSAVFSINSSDAGRSSTYPESPEEAGDVTFPASARTTASAPATRPPSIRHTMSALTPVRRERSRTIASPEEERASLTAFPFESSERRGLDIQGAAWPEQPALQPPQRRRTTSSFGSLIGPPLGSLKRNLSFNRKSPMGFGSRSEASSRRSSVIDSSEAISEDHIATGPYNAPASSSQASLESRRGSKGVFGRSATDTDLLPSHSESQKALKTSTKSSSRSQSQDTSSALKSLGKAPSRAQPQASAAATATTALADVKVKGSMSSGSFLTRSLSKRFTFNSTSESTDSTGRASRPLSLRRFTSNASQQREMPTPLAEETERSSYEFGKLDDETVAASSKAA